MSWEPTDDELQTIGDWDTLDFNGLAEYMNERWGYPDYSDLLGDVWLVSTGGWSGHEEALAELPAMWTYFHGYSTRRGGHYVFTRLGRDPLELDRRNRGRIMQQLTGCKHP